MDIGSMHFGISLKISDCYVVTIIWHILMFMILLKYASLQSIKR